MAEPGPGEHVGDYRIESVAGRGGMGVVYRATQAGLGRTVALKLIAPGLAADPDFRERFVRESRLAAAIDHPHVIPVYEAGETDGVLFLATRYVDGVDLGEIIKEAPEGLDPSRAVRLVAQIGSALDAAHRRGLVHRDVKPANALVSQEDGEHVYLTDFGLTKRDSDGTKLTRTGLLVGTLAYISPEQVNGDPATGASDIYALGCVLWHALVGEAPFQRGSDVATMYAHVNDPVPVLSQVRPGLPPGLDDVIARALAKDPADRFATAAEFAQAATAALEAGASPSAGTATVVSGGPPPTVTQTGSAATVVPGTPAATTVLTAADGERARRRPALIGAVALLGLGGVVAILAVAGVIGGGDDAKDAKTATTGGAPAAPAATIDVGDRPEGLGVDRGNVYVVNVGDSTLARIDAKTNTVVGEPIDVGGNPDSVAVGKGVVWSTSTSENFVRRIDAAGPVPVPGRKIPVGTSPEGIAIGPQLVWVVNSGDNTAQRIDRAEPKLTGGPIAAGRKPVGVFVGSSVWIANSGDDTVIRIDPGTTQRIGRPIAVGDDPRSVVEGAGVTWVANTGDNTVTRIDAKTGKVVGDPIPVGDTPREVVLGFGSLWVANSGDNTVTQIDADSGRVVGSPIPVGSTPAGIAAGAGAVWVSNSGDDTVTRIDPT